MCVTKLSKQNIWWEIIQRHGKGGVSMTIPPAGYEVQEKIVLSHKLATYEFIPFLFFSKVAEIWFKDEWKMYKEEMEAEQKI